MQPKTYFSLFKSFCITVAAAFSLGTASLQAGQFTYTTPVNSSGNNFTMLAAGGGVSIGGTNDAVFTWDGTLNDAVAGAVVNGGLSSDEAFFSSLWIAHDLMLYGPGNYTVLTAARPETPVAVRVTQYLSPLDQTRSAPTCCLTGRLVLIQQQHRLTPTLMLSWYGILTGHGKRSTFRLQTTRSLRVWMTGQVVLQQRTYHLARPLCLPASLTGTPILVPLCLTSSQPTLTVTM